MQPLQSHITARALILDADNKLLIVRRSPSDPLHPGTWDLPGGRNEPGEDVRVTAIREAQEEVGITLQNPTLVFATSDMRDGVSKTWLFYAEHIAEGVDVHLGDEHDAFQWIDPADLEEYTDYDILLRMHRYVTHNNIFA